MKSFFCYFFILVFLASCQTTSLKKNENKLKNQKKSDAKIIIGAEINSGVCINCNY